MQKIDKVNTGNIDPSLSKDDILKDKLFSLYDLPDSLDKDKVHQLVNMTEKDSEFKNLD